MNMEAAFGQHGWFWFVLTMIGMFTLGFMAGSEHEHRSHE